MDPYILFPYWFTLLLLVLNALAVSRIEIDIEDEEAPNKDHD